MIIGSIYVTAGAILVGVPVGILAAIYMAKFCNEKVYKIVNQQLIFWQEFHLLFMDSLEW